MSTRAIELFFAVGTAEARRIDWAIWHSVEPGSRVVVATLGHVLDAIVGSGPKLDKPSRRAVEVPGRRGLEHRISLNCRPACSSIMTSVSGSTASGRESTNSSNCSADSAKGIGGAASWSGSGMPKSDDQSRHTCHAHGCESLIPPKMFMCRHHWFSLPKNVRAAIWNEYTPGQERTKKPSLRYLAVQQYAICRAAFKPNDEEAALVCAGYLQKALAWQAEAIAAGDGDPLEGLVPAGEQA